MLSPLFSAPNYLNDPVIDIDDKHKLNGIGISCGYLKMKFPSLVRLYCDARIAKIFGVQMYRQLTRCGRPGGRDRIIILAVAGI